MAFAGLILALFPTAASIASEKDIAEIKQLLKNFEQTRGNREGRTALYAENANIFSRNGTEAIGRKAAMDYMFRTRTPTPANSPARPPAKIVIDGVDAGDRIGYIFGRTCQGTNGGPPCQVRFLLVTEKGADGKWRILQDIDANRLDPQSVAKPANSH
jgi:ketosteroid isomerase-like protein